MAVASRPFDPTRTHHVIKATITSQCKPVCITVVTSNSGRVKGCLQLFVIVISKMMVNAD